MVAYITVVRSTHTESHLISLDAISQVSQYASVLKDPFNTYIKKNTKSRNRVNVREKHKLNAMIDVCRTNSSSGAIIYSPSSTCGFLSGSAYG